MDEGSLYIHQLVIDNPEDVQVLSQVRDRGDEGITLHLIVAACSHKIIHSLTEIVCWHRDRKQNGMGVVSGCGFNMGHLDGERE